MFTTNTTRYNIKYLLRCLPIPHVCKGCEEKCERCDDVCSQRDGKESRNYYIKEKRKGRNPTTENVEKDVEKGEKEKTRVDKNEAASSQDNEIKTDDLEFITRLFDNNKENHKETMNNKPSKSCYSSLSISFLCQQDISYIIETRICFRNIHRDRS